MGKQQVKDCLEKKRYLPIHETGWDLPKGAAGEAGQYGCEAPIALVFGGGVWGLEKG